MKCSDPAINALTACQRYADAYQRVYVPGGHSSKEALNRLLDAESEVLKAGLQASGLCICSRCSKRCGHAVVKPKEEFYTVKDRRNGYSPWCKECVKENTRINYVRRQTENKV